MPPLASRLVALLLVCLPASAWAAASPSAQTLDLTAHPIGVAALAVFVLAYVLVVLEERLELRKSKPVMLAAAVIWMLIGIHAEGAPGLAQGYAGEAFRHVFLEFAELFFFLIVAMSFVAAIGERNVFQALRAELVSRRFSYHSLFWLTGIISFFMSAVLDNLTTALIMSGVILAVGAGNVRFVTLAFINLVVAANAGGAWSAFGDITTLMVWQAKRVEFFEFFRIFVPSLVNWLVPAVCMISRCPSPRLRPGQDDADVKYGGWVVCALFAITIAITVAAKQLLHMPPVFGMMAGLALLKVQGYFIRRHENQRAQWPAGDAPYNVFKIIARAEWDTLLFFYGVLISSAGWPRSASCNWLRSILYGDLGPTWANVAMGVLSAIVDNIPIMYAVLQMEPAMDHGQWLLITLTCGVGGSLLSVGSAAGVALMGVSKGQYTFLRAPEMDLGHRAGLYRQYPCASVAECLPLRRYLKQQCTNYWW